MKNKKQVIMALALIALFFLLIPAASANAADPYVAYNAGRVTEIKMEVGQSITVYAKNFMGLTSWSSSDTSVAAVSYKGNECQIRAIKGGKAVVTVTGGGKSVNVTIIVDSFAVKSYVPLGIGEKTKLYEGTPKGKITIKNKNKKVCSVSKKGVIKGKKEGTAKIILKVKGGRKYVCAVSVQSVRFDESFKVQMVTVGGKFNVGLMDVGTLEYTVKSNDESIATFEGLEGTGHRQGCTTYTVTCNGKVYEGTIYVIDNIETNFAVLGPTNISIKSGESVVVNCFGACKSAFNFKGSNAEVCSISGFEELMPNAVKMTHGVFNGESWYNSFTINGLEPGECTIAITEDRMGNLISAVTLKVTVY